MALPDELSAANIAILVSKRRVGLPKLISPFSFSFPFASLCLSFSFYLSLFRSPSLSPSLSPSTAFPGCPYGSGFSSFLYRLSASKASNDWNGTGRDLRVGFVRLRRFGLSPVVRGVQEHFSLGLILWNSTRSLRVATIHHATGII